MQCTLLEVDLSDWQQRAALIGWLKKDPPAMAYVDPPWNSGAARSFRRRAGKDSEGKVDFPRLLDHLLAVLYHVDGPCWVEMGKQHVDLLAAMVHSVGGATQVFPITYYTNRPAHLVRIINMGQTTPSTPVELPPHVPDDSQTPRIAIEIDTVPGELVLDCCVGNGLTAVAALELGRRFIGADINKGRLESTARTVEVTCGTHVQPKQAAAATVRGDTQPEAAARDAD